MKIGNNDKCTCGSNLKYKKCCRDKHVEEARLSKSSFVFNSAFNNHQPKTEEDKEMMDSIENSHIDLIKEKSKLLPEIEKLLDFEPYRKAIGVKELKDSDKIKICDSILITYYMEEMDKLNYTSFNASTAPFAKNAVKFLNDNNWLISSKSLMENTLELISLTTSKKNMWEIINKELGDILLALNVFNTAGREALIKLYEESKDKK
jgi:hypothetical protein